MTMTIAELETRIGIQVDEHLIRDAEIPVISGRPQRQGDIIALPTTRAATTPLTRAGVAVVRGENGGNTHAVHADTGTSLFDLDTTGGQRLGLLTVSPDSTVILSHPEHGFMAFGPGNYVFNRQREQADQIRIVAD